MALIYFYDASSLDKRQLEDGLKNTDHRWEYVEEGIALDNLNPDAEVISVFVSSVVTPEIIEALPHGDECVVVFNTITDRWEIDLCNCPKSKIGSK